MRKRNKFAINKKLIILIALILLVLYWIIGFVINVVKQVNLYNLETADYVDINLYGKSLIVYDEYVINSYENTGVELTEDRIYSQGEEIPATINVDANSKSVGISTFLNNLDLGPGQREKKSNEYTVNYNTGREIEDLSTIQDYESIYNNLINKNISDLNLSYLDDINRKNIRYNDEKVMAEDFESNKSFVLSKPGVLSSQLDGFEDLINFDNIDKFNISNLTIDSEDTKLNGLKYVNNKRYYLIFKVDDIQTFNDYSLSNIDIIVDQNSYKPSNTVVIKTLDGQTYLKIMMTEGFNDLFGKRYVDTTIKLTRLNAMKVLSRSLVEKEGIDGVYKILRDRVVFTPVKVLFSQGNYSYISTDINSIYSRAYLELVDENNSMVNYDPNNPDYISILELNEFDKIVKNPNLVEEGDSY